MKRAPRSRQRHDLYAKYHDYDSEISDLLGECGLKGACVVLTGPMRMGTRDFIIAEIEGCGGEVGKTTTRKTDYVVVSSTASKNWRTTHFGTKIERAKELIVEGYKLRFVTETALEAAIKLQAKSA
jgi:NAD-dependent DNA ligase